jgi:hypothetical protein
LAGGLESWKNQDTPDYYLFQKKDWARKEKSKNLGLSPSLSLSVV